MEKESFTPDYHNKKGTITIEVFTNSHPFKIESSENKMTIQEVIGALEIVKTNLVVNQGFINEESYKKLKEKAKKEVAITEARKEKIWKGIKEGITKKNK